MKNILTSGAAIVMFATVLAGCRDLVDKVSKQPIDVGVSNTQSTDSEKDSAAKSLKDAEHFLKNVDDLRGVAIDQIIAELSKGDYRKRFREGFRFYRAAVIAKAANPKITDKNLFQMPDDKDCISASADLNIEDADKYLGIVMQAGVLATLSKGGQISLNGEKSKELEAVGELILKDLGIEAKGDSNVEDKDGMKVTTASFHLKLISDKDDDEATKAADDAEVLNLSFVRSADADSLGTFAGDMSIGHLLDSGAVETIALKINVSRAKNAAGLLAHKADVTLGIQGKDPIYSHSVSFEQMSEGSKIFLITDIKNKGMSGENSLKYELNLGAKELCKEGKSHYENNGDGATKGGGDNTGKPGSEPNPVNTPAPTPTPAVDPAPPVATPTATATPTSTCGKPGVVVPGKCDGQTPTQGSPVQGPGQSTGKT
jgi:hypothetical protein